MPGIAAHSAQIRIANGSGNDKGSEISDAFSEVRIGWNNDQDAPPGFTPWIDDVALDDERVGCDRACDPRRRSCYHRPP